jgi:ribosomal protein S18 acetylase RimI-like enzyme
MAHPSPHRADCRVRQNERVTPARAREDGVMIERGFTPGIVGDVTALHGRYYARTWNFAPHFEIVVAEGLARFFTEYDPARDVALWVREDGAVRGFVAIWALRDDPAEARLRWFILDDALRGRGLGRALIAAAMEHCRNVGFRRVELFTFAGLTAARALYREAGFHLIEERERADWGAPILWERFEIVSP